MVPEHGAAIRADKMQIANPNSSATDFEVKDGQVLFAPGTETNN